jgi:hypothetical protein
MLILFKNSQPIKTIGMSGGTSGNNLGHAPFT